MTLVTAEDRGAVRHVVLNRPEKRNAMNQALLTELAAALRRRRRCLGPLRRAARRRPGVLRRRGPRRAGRLRGRAERAAAVSQRVPGRARTSAKRCPSPSSARSTARAWAARWRWRSAATCASPRRTSRLGLPEVRFGIIPDVGGSSRLPAVVGLGRAKELIMTGAHDRRHGGAPHRLGQPRGGERAGVGGGHAGAGG